MSARRPLVALCVVAGVLVTATPATADVWARTDHSSAVVPWDGTDHHATGVTTPTTTPTRHRIAATPRTGAPATRHLPRTRIKPQRAAQRWQPSITCRTTLGTRWIVGPGDTLDLVARCHPGVTVEAIAARNGIRMPQALIRERQVLHIPAAREGLR
jgi:hypothetical protein